MSDLELTVLGSATPYPRPGQPCSGYLVTCDGIRLWLDAGTGTLAELQRHTGLADLAAIWISHTHADHTADLLTAYYAACFADIALAAPIPLYGPPGLADRLATFLADGPARSPVDTAFAVHELRDGHRVELGGLSLTSRAVRHGVPAFAVRVAAGDRSLVYSGDTAPCPSLTALAAGCDALLCEADSAGPAVEGPAVHHTPEEAGETARAARAARLIVTHIGPLLTPHEAVGRAATRYGGRVDHAAPGRCFTIGPATVTSPPSTASPPHAASPPSFRLGGRS